MLALGFSSLQIDEKDLSDTLEEDESGTRVLLEVEADELR